MSQDNFILVAHTCSGVYHIERFVVEQGEARAVSRFKMSSAASMIVRQEMMLTKWFELISILIRSMRARICSTMSINLPATDRYCDSFILYDKSLGSLTYVQNSYNCMIDSHSFKK